MLVNLASVSISAVCLRAGVRPRNRRSLLGVSGTLVLRLIVALRRVWLQLHAAFVRRVESLLGAVGVARGLRELILALLARTVALFGVFAAPDTVFGENDVNREPEHVFDHAW